MSLHSIRLDQQTEQQLQHLIQLTGFSISGVIKEGIKTLEQRVNQPTQTPYEIYASLELGRGGTARYPSHKAKEGIKAILKKKYKK